MPVFTSNIEFDPTTTGPPTRRRHATQVHQSAARSQPAANESTPDRLAAPHHYYCGSGRRRSRSSVVAKSSCRTWQLTLSAYCSTIQLTVYFQAHPEARGKYRLNTASRRDGVNLWLGSSSLKLEAHPNAKTAAVRLRIKPSAGTFSVSVTRRWQSWVAHASCPQWPRCHRRVGTVWTSSTHRSSR